MATLANIVIVWRSVIDLSREELRLATGESRRPRRCDAQTARGLRRSFRMGVLGGQLFTLRGEEYGYKIKELLRRLTSRRAEAEAEAVLGGERKEKRSEAEEEDDERAFLSLRKKTDGWAGRRKESSWTARAGRTGRVYNWGSRRGAEKWALVAGATDTSRGLPVAVFFFFFYSRFEALYFII